MNRQISGLLGGDVAIHLYTVHLSTHVFRFPQENQNFWTKRGLNIQENFCFCLPRISVPIPRYCSWCGALHELPCCASASVTWPTAGSFWCAKLSWSSPAGCPAVWWPLGMSAPRRSVWLGPTGSFRKTGKKTGLKRNIDMENLSLLHVYVI